LTDNQIYSLFVDGSNFYAGAGSGVFLSTNTGASWTNISNNLPLYPVYSLAVMNGNIFAGTWGMGAYVSTNGGQSWTAINNGLTDNVVMTLAVIENTLFAGTTQGVFKTTNSGSNWTLAINGLTTHYTLALYTVGANLFSGSWGGGVFLTTDMGENWTSVSAGLTNMDDRAFTVYGDELYLAAVGGVWKRPLQEIIPVELTSFTVNSLGNDVVLKWSTSTETNNKGFDVQRHNGSEFQSIAFIEGFGTSTESHSYSYIDKEKEPGSHTYRLKQLDFDGSYQYSPIVEVIIVIPDKFELSQNYPNPFNPATQIEFSIPSDVFVSLKVYNAIGQQVADLVDGIIKAGNHQITFNAANLSSGVYYYRIEANNEVLMKKMLLLK
jgi:hypothetical protein